MDTIETLKQKAREWASKVVKLYNTPVPKELESEKNSLLKYAKVVKESIEKVLGKVDEFGEIDKIDGLGFVLPLVPVVAISAAAVAIANWYYRNDALTKKLSAYSKLVDGGLSHQQALSVIKESSDSGGGIVSSIAAGMSIPIVGAALIFGYMILGRQ